MRLTRYDQMAGAELLPNLDQRACFGPYTGINSLSSSHSCRRLGTPSRTKVLWLVDIPTTVSDHGRTGNTTNPFCIGCTMKGTCHACVFRVPIRDTLAPEDSQGHPGLVADFNWRVTVARYVPCWKSLPNSHPGLWCTWKVIATWVD